jgi:hypothetical protein
MSSLSLFVSNFFCSIHLFYRNSYVSRFAFRSADLNTSSLHGRSYLGLLTSALVHSRSGAYESREKEDGEECGGDEPEDEEGFNKKGDCFGFFIFQKEDDGRREE